MKILLATMLLSVLLSACNRRNQPRHEIAPAGSEKVIEIAGVPSSAG